MPLQVLSGQCTRMHLLGSSVNRGNGVATHRELLGEGCAETRGRGLWLGLDKLLAGYRTCDMASEPRQRDLGNNILSAFQRVIYFAIALTLSIPIVMLFVSAVMGMLQVSEEGVLETVLTVLDRVLLVFIFVELLDTVRVTVRERGIF